jgi:hypothetical protein
MKNHLHKKKIEEDYEEILIRMTLEKYMEEEG